MTKTDMTKHIPNNITPEEYFKYFCDDAMAVAMFHKFIDNYDLEKEARIRELEQTVDQYEIEIDALKYDIDDLEDALERAVATIAELKSMINNLEADNG